MEIENYNENDSYGVMYIYVGNFGLQVKTQMDKFESKKRYYNRKEIIKGIVIGSASQADFMDKMQALKTTIRSMKPLITVICVDVNDVCDKATMDKIVNELNSEKNLLYCFALTDGEEDDCTITRLENYITYKCNAKSQNSAEDIAKIMFAFECLLHEPGVIGLDYEDFYQILKCKKGESRIVGGNSSEELYCNANEVFQNMISDAKKPSSILMLCYMESESEFYDVMNEAIKERVNASDNVSIIPFMVQCGAGEKQIVMCKLQDNIPPNRKILPHYGMLRSYISNNIALKKQRFICVDIETSGIEENAEIIKLSAVEIANGKFQSMFETLIKPKKEIPNTITEITGIENAQLKNAPSINEAMQDFKEYCKNSILVGHNIKGYTMKFLNKKAEECGLEPFKNEIIDTLEIAKERVRFVENYNLKTLCYRFDIADNYYMTKKDDVILTAELFTKLYEKEVKVGIFWALLNGIFERHESVKLDIESLSPSAIKTGRIDSDYGHDTVWNENFGENGLVDFATYPRGRVLYDYINSKHIIFIDECITNGDIEKIIEIFDVKEYSLEYDEHYRCDGCLDF